MAISDLLHVTAEPLEDAIIIRATGEIDISTIEVIRSGLDRAREQTGTVLLDLSGITFIDSSGLRLLLEASRSSAVSGWYFFVVRPSEAVTRLVQLSGRADSLLMVVDPSADRLVA